MTSKIKPSTKVLTKDYTYDFAVDLVWNTRDEMIKWIRNKGKELMMVLIIENSNPKRVRMNCEHYGEHWHKNFDVRGNSKKWNCPFMIEGFRLSREKKTKEETWGGLTVVDGHHNHDIATTFEGHSFMGRMTPLEEDTVTRWTDLRMNPREIQIELATVFPGNVTSIKQNNNFRQKMQFEDFIGITCMVEMVGFSSIGKTFNIAFAFTKGEDQSHYVFILQEKDDPNQKAI